MYKEILEKRLERRKEQIEHLTETQCPTTENKRRYLELKVIVAELETIIDIAETVCDLQTRNVT